MMCPAAPEGTKIPWLAACGEKQRTDLSACPALQQLMHSFNLPRIGVRHQTSDDLNACLHGFSSHLGLVAGILDDLIALLEAPAAHAPLDRRTIGIVIKSLSGAFAFPSCLAAPH